jgi:hypothetical protein
MAVAPWIVSDELWELFEPLLPKKERHERRADIITPSSPTQEFNLNDFLGPMRDHASTRSSVFLRRREAASTFVPARHHRRLGANAGPLEWWFESTQWSRSSAHGDTGVQ